MLGNTNSGLVEGSGEMCRDRVYDRKLKNTLCMTQSVPKSLRNKTDFMGSSCVGNTSLRGRPRN